MTQRRPTPRLWAGLALLVAVGCGHPEVAFVLNREGQPSLAQVEARVRESVREHNAAEYKRQEEAEEKGEEYQLNLRDESKEVKDAQNRRADHDQAIVDILDSMFGTPDDPAAFGGMAVSGLDPKKLRLSAGPADDPQGRGLFRKHCVHCHGISGDGNGPTARFLNPFPRDFRRGIFKFKSTAPLDAMPTRADLQRTISEGINGTAMPSFKVLLRSDEVEALAEYVAYLSMRGLVELELRIPENDQGKVDYYVQTIDDLAPETYDKILANLQKDPSLDRLVEQAAKIDADETKLPDDVRGLLAELRVPLQFARWRRVEAAAQTHRSQLEAIQQLEKEIVEQRREIAKNIAAGQKAKPPDEKELANLALRDAILSRRLDEVRGIFIPPQRDAAMEKLIAQQDAQQLFLVKANCIKCHGPTGLGDGGQLDFDSWNKLKDDQRKAGLTPEDLAERFNLPLQRAQPRNLRLGIYRGGRRPVDIYRRIAVGINGTPMPAHAAKDATDTKNLQPHEIWALVDYVLDLPYQEGGERRHEAVAEGPQRGRL